jgi:hypothetical protein
MIYEYSILHFLAQKFATTDAFNLLGLTQCAVVTKVNPLPVSDADKLFPCITLQAGEANNFDPADEGAQEATYNVKVSYYRAIVEGENLSDVMSRELALIADEFKAWGNLSGLMLPNASPQMMYFNGPFETIEGFFERESTGEYIAVWGYFHLQIKITNLL